MKTTLTRDALAAYLARQLSNFFPDREVSGSELQPFVDAGLDRLAICFSRISDKYLPAGQEQKFNPRHTDHYAMFLYLVANTIRKMGGDLELADKLYALNKALHAIDVYHEVELPEVFFFQHPVGTVLGRAKYGNYFMVYQRCTVGAKDQTYPSIGEGVVMFGGSAIIGDCAIGSNVWLSLGTIVLGENIPDNSVVFGQPPKIVVKPTQRNIVRDLFDHPSGRS
jgi:serine O-acetyltransferase